jgi:hypothetical protein
MEHFWQRVTDDFTGSDLVATLLFYGNKVHCKLEGVKPVFESISEVYKLINANPNDATMEVIVKDFQETQEYKAVQELAETVSKKKLT